MCQLVVPVVLLVCCPNRSTRMCVLFSLCYPFIFRSLNIDLCVTGALFGLHRVLVLALALPDIRRVFMQ